MPRGNGTGPQGYGPGTQRGQRRGRGAGGGLGLGPGGQCHCPNCGHTEPHLLSTPCYNKKCPKCGAPMIRA